MLKRFNESLPFFDKTLALISLLGVELLKRGACLLLFIFEILRGLRSD